MLTQAAFSPSEGGGKQTQQEQQEKTVEGDRTKSESASNADDSKRPPNDAMMAGCSSSSCSTGSGTIEKPKVELDIRVVQCKEMEKSFERILACVAVVVVEEEKSMDQNVDACIPEETETTTVSTMNEAELIETERRADVEEGEIVIEEAASIDGGEGEGKVRETTEKKKKEEEEEMVEGKGAEPVTEKVEEVEEEANDRVDDGDKVEATAVVAMGENVNDGAGTTTTSL